MVHESGESVGAKWLGHPDSVDRESGYDLATILPQDHGPLPDAFLEA